MQIVVTQVSAGKSGQPQRVQRRLPGSVFAIGRGTACPIHLPDARVAQVHAQLRVEADGATLQAEGGSVEINGREAQGKRLVPGDVIAIGPFLLRVEPPPPDAACAISIEENRRAAWGAARAAFRAIAHATEISRRRLSWLAFLATVLPFGLAPVLPDLLGHFKVALDAPLRDNVHALALGSALAWDPGPLAPGHRAISQDCRACHQTPFVQVRDEACLACHGGVREHGRELRRAAHRAEAKLRCAHCHRDHKNRPMAPRDQALCVQCHRQPPLEDSVVRAASDFAIDHPPFRLALADALAPGRNAVRRVRQDEPGIPLREFSNLKFNHALHLDPRGVRDPEGRRDPAGMYDARGRRRVLICENCHQPDSSGTRMLPPSMTAHCQSCHSLAFEPAAPRRQVPHAPLAEVETTLGEFYARAALGEVEVVRPIADLPRVRPGLVPTVDERLAIAAAVERKARRALEEMLGRRGVCGTCHHLERDARSGAREIAPVRLTRVWLPSTHFSHADHATHACTTCHAASRSKSSEDVLIPGIGKCRECHGGAGERGSRVASDCASCHRFHAGEQRWEHAMSRAAIR